MRAILLFLLIPVSLAFFPAPQLVCARLNIDSRIQSVLKWLPPDTESIAVLRSPVTFDVDSDQPIDPESVYQLPFVIAVLTSGEEFSTADIPVSDISLSVQSAGKWDKDKRGTKLGGRPFAYISFLSPNPQRDSKMQECLRKNAHENYMDCGQMVSELVLKDHCAKNSEQHAHDVLYKCLPREGLVIATEDKSLMHVILSRMVSNKACDQALSANLPEWQEVDTLAQYWGLRHFQSDDPTSPLTGSPYLEKVYPQVDRRATGLVFSYSPESQILEAKYLSENPDIKSFVEATVNVNHIGFEWGRTEIKQTKQGVVRMTIFPSREACNPALYSGHAWLGAPTPWPFGG